MKYILPALLLAALSLVPYVWVTTQQAKDAAEDRALVESANHAHGDDLNWAQDNLKRHDIGCPTAVFIAPAGELVQCQALREHPIQVWKQTPAELPAHAVVLPGYPTIEEAAIRGLAAIMQKTSALWYEWGGYIVKASNGYVVLPANTSFAAQHVTIATQPDIFVVVASYHTHVCNSRFAHEFFSPTDLGDPIFLRRTVFMGDVCTGLVHEFKPGDKPDLVQVNGDGSPWSSPGQIIGKFTTTHAAL